MRQLKGTDILEIVTPAAVLAKYEGPIAEAIRCDMEDREFLDLCDAQSQACGKQRWTLSLAKVPQDLQSETAAGRVRERGFWVRSSGSKRNRGFSTLAL